MPIKHVIKMPVIKAKVVVFIGDKKDIKRPESIPERCMVDNDGPLARMSGMVDTNSKYAFNAVIHSRSAAISVIAHEAVHAAMYIQDQMGCVADWENDELTAYIVQHICQEVEGVLDASS